MQELQNDWREFLKLGGSFIYDMAINWLDFGFHRSKSKVTTGPNMGKNQFLSYNSIQMYQVSTFVDEKDLLGQCHQTTIHGEKMQFWSHNSHLMFQAGAFVNQKGLMGQC